jgi:hypothetical protein
MERARVLECLTAQAPECPSPSRASRLQHRSWAQLLKSEHGNMMEKRTLRLSGDCASICRRFHFSSVDLSPPFARHLVVAQRDLGAADGFLGELIADGVEIGNSHANDRIPREKGWQGANAASGVAFPRQNSKSPPTFPHWNLTEPPRYNAPPYTTTSALGQHEIYVYKYCISKGQAGKLIGRSPTESSDVSRQL